MKAMFVFMLFITFIGTNAQENKRYIDVNGTAEVNIPADQIDFSVQIRVVRETIEDSKKQVDASVNSLLGTLNDQGIDKEDIQVSPAMLGKNYNYDSGERKFNGYFASSSVTFKLKDLSKYLPISDQLAKDQTIEIVNSFFSLSDYEARSREAYEKALKAATEKAEYMTKTLGVKTGRILEINENNQNYPMPYNMAVMEKSDTGGNLVSGKVVITRTVRVKYELAD